LARRKRPERPIYLRFLDTFSEAAACLSRNSRLLSADPGLKPGHPFGVLEFVCDTIGANGEIWPSFGIALAPNLSECHCSSFLHGSDAHACAGYQPTLRPRT
jgi:hypothetical protein